tara:strand:- start:41 stop:586 length:546 start_codon:yes stop_codon:yes gene_type:complete
MKLELLIIGITGIFVANIYYNGELFKKCLKWKKYYKMAFYIFLGFSVYLLLKKNPNNGKNLLLSANNLIKMMPVDKDSKEFFSPLMQFSKLANAGDESTPQFKRMMNSGKKGGTKRCVSETKKKYVASNQQWKCADCRQQLPAWFEVDHIIRLENGGSNHVENLRALCRNCHGKKTAFENF